VTLRGVVETQLEKDAIDAIAKNIAGASRVDNQLEVKAG
jgi:osmotically-inducible protein OsmY